MEGVKSPTLPSALRERMAQKSHTQIQAAAEMGTTSANVSRWIGGAEPRAEFYEPLCAYLKITLHELGALVIETEFQKLQREQL